jgi:hypothetical protein
MLDKTPWPIHSIETDKAEQLLDAGVTIQLTYSIEEIPEVEK